MSSGFRLKKLVGRFSQQNFPNKNLLVIDRVKRCSIKSLNLSISNERNFRTRVQPKVSSGLGHSPASSNEGDQTKRLSILQLFNPSNPGKDQQEGFKKLLKQAKLNNDEKDQLKIAFAEGYLAASGKDGQKKKGFLQTLVDKTFLIAFLIVAFYFVRDRGVKILMGSSKNEVSAEEIEVTFNDALGVDEAKGELKEVVEFLRDPEKFSKLGARLPRGVLLVGPPGTGKTLLARAVAGEAGVPFFHASGSEFDELLVGQGARRIRDLFANAKSKAPCVVFIDEIDSVGGKRTKSAMHPYANQTINQLLSEMDGFHSNEGIIVLGATNRREDLDHALLRPGRFDVEVRVRKPDLAGRKEILNYYLKKIKLAENVDIDGLAKATINFSGADIENLCNQAALKAAIDDEGGVSMKHLEEAKDKILMGPALKRQIPEDTNRLTAYHEAGHTLVAWFTKEATNVHKVTILSRGGSLGHTALRPEKEQYQTTKAQMLAQLDVAMGGRVAEEMIFGEDKITSGAYSDLRNATAIAKRMVKYFGMSDRVGLAVHESRDKFYNETSNSMQELIDNEIKLLLQESYERAKSLLKDREKELHLIAKALLDHETLDANQIRKILKGEKLDLEKSNSEKLSN